MMEDEILEANAALDIKLEMERQEQQRATRGTRPRFRRRR